MAKCVGSTWTRVFTALLMEGLMLCAVRKGDAATSAHVAEETARISMPWDNALVRADVPIFGVATAPDFKLYRLEFGEGTAPRQWHVITVSQKPQSVDPWAAGKVKWNPNTGARGNLATWRTGLTSYRYGTQESNLNGIYTLRLVVEGRPVWHDAAHALEEERR